MQIMHNMSWIFCANPVSTTMSWKNYVDWNEAINKCTETCIKSPALQITLQDILNQRMLVLTAISGPIMVLCSKNRSGWPCFWACYMSMSWVFGKSGNLEQHLPLTLIISEKTLVGVFVLYSPSYFKCLFNIISQSKRKTVQQKVEK